MKKAKNEDILKCAQKMYHRIACALADAMDEYGSHPGSTHMAHQLAVSMLAHFVEIEKKSDAKKEMPSIKEDAWLRIQEGIDSLAREMALDHHRSLRRIEVSDRLANMVYRGD